MKSNFVVSVGGRKAAVQYGHQQRPTMAPSAQLRRRSHYRGGCQRLLLFKDRGRAHLLGNDCFGQVVFRGCSLPLLLAAGVTPRTAALLCPLSFGNEGLLLRTGVGDHVRCGGPQTDVAVYGRGGALAPRVGADAAGLPSLCGRCQCALPGETQEGKGSLWQYLRESSRCVLADELSRFM